MLHKIIKRKKNETVYKETNEFAMVGDCHKRLFYPRKELAIYEQFYCEKTKKLSEPMGAWNFDYCPFCGEKIEDEVYGVNHFTNGWNSK